MMRWWLLLGALSADGGIDAGVTDAGVAAVKVPVEPWRWTHADGGWLDDGGVTDRVSMRVGQTAEVVLDHPIILMQCDEQLVTLGATEKSLLLTAVRAGHTRCGFWYEPRSWPHRTLDLAVMK